MGGQGVLKTKKNQKFKKKFNLKKKKFSRATPGPLACYILSSDLCLSVWVSDHDSRTP